jgi:cysteine desulfuration protein SufE
MPTTPTSLPPSLDRVVQRLSRVSEPKQRYEQLIWFAKRLKPFPDGDRVAENKVSGCASQVYVTATPDQETIQFAGDSDSQLVKGLVALLVEGLSGLTAAEILSLSPEFIQKTGLDVSLTPSRSNGFYNIFKLMQQKTLELAAIEVAAPPQS